MLKFLFSPQNPWKTSFFVIVFALFLFVTISGFITFFWPSTHFFIQFNVLFHTGVGILAGVLMGYFYLRHWLIYRGRKNKHNISRNYRWTGHIAGTFILVSLLTGILMIFTGISGQSAFIYWGHIVVSLVGFGALVYHQVHSFIKQTAKRDGVQAVKATPINRAAEQKSLTGLPQILTTHLNKGELLVLCFNLDIDYNNLPGEGKKNKATELVAYLEHNNLTSKFVSKGKQLRPDIFWDDAAADTAEPSSEFQPPPSKPLPARKKTKRAISLPIWKGLPVSILLVIVLILLCAALGSTYQHSTANTIELPQYSYPYGNNPFSPSQITTPNLAFINEEVMVNSAQCGQTNCHPDIYEQWSESAHRYSTDDPWFGQALEEMVKNEGNNPPRYCGGCHDPIALLSGKIDTLGSVRNNHKDEGISCISCHSITKINDLTGTSSYTFTPPDRYLFWDQKGVVPEYLNYLLIRLKPGPHRDTFMKPFFQDSAYCSLCHKQFIDQRSNNYRWLRLQNQYDNWHQSGFSQESVFVWYPQEKKSCNDCHMENEPSNDPAANDGQVHSHRYATANTALPFYYGYQTQLEKTIEWLQRDEVRVDIFAMALSEEDTEQVIAPLNRLVPQLTAGETYIFDVSVTNNIAHAFPTGPIDLFQPYLEFKITDGTGTEIFSSGFIDEAGFLDPYAHQFIAPPITGDGEWVRKHDLWNEHTVGFKSTLPAQQTDIIHYKASIPKTAIPPYTLTSRVRYRRFNRWYTEWVLGQDAPRLPIVDLDLDVVTLGSNQVAVAPLSEDYLRFNQYGIGLLRQKLYPEAEKAFAYAAQLNPAYADAYINAALVNLQRDSLPQAENWLIRALETDPSSLRGQAYLGILRQRQGKLEEAITLLTKVLDQYPRDRKVLFELGKTFYLSQQHEQAIKIFQMALDIDPDQTAIYSYLELCYDELGQVVEAQVAGNEFSRLERLPVKEGRSAFFQANEWAQKEEFLYHTH